MRTVSIQYLTPEHIDDVLRINTLSFSDPWSKYSFEKELENKFAHYIIAIKNDIVIGYAGIWIILDEAHIISIAVQPEYRGLGISNLLMNEIFNICKKNYVSGLTLEVRKSNFKAQYLYKKYGFIEEGTRPHYYPDLEDAIIMWNRNIY